MMLHKVFSTIGLGILGIDPITAVYLLSMGLRKEKKSKITLFFLSFAGCSIFVGVGLAAALGMATAEFLERLIPGEDSPVWAILEFSVSVFILVWVFRRVFRTPESSKTQKREIVNGNNFKYITTGFAFAIASFTDPTFYAVVLLGSESGNIITAAILLSIWFAVSQFMAVIVYIANQLNLFSKLMRLMDDLKKSNLKIFMYIFYGLLVLLAFVLMIDTGFYLLAGRYLF